MKPKTPRDKLVDELGEDIVEWGEKVESVFEELLPADGTEKLDDRPTPIQPNPKAAEVAAGKRERIVRDKRGYIMRCVICDSELTVDGRYCGRHS